MVLMAGFLMIPSQFFAMDSFVSSLTHRVGQIASQVADAGRAAGGVLQWQSGGAGDPLQIDNMPLDLKKVLLHLALKQYPLTEKVRRIGGQLRKVCKNWDALLHDERVLGYLLPRLFFEGGPGEILVSRSVEPAAQFTLKSMIKGFLIDPRMLHSMGRLLEAPGVNRSAARVSGMYLLCGPPGTGKRSLGSLVAKNLGLEPKCFNVSMLDQYSIHEASEVIARFFDINELSVIVIDEIEMLFRYIQGGLTRGQISNVFLESLEKASANNVCILCADNPSEISKHFLRKCSVQQHIMNPLPAARRVILQLHVDALLQKHCAQPEPSAVVEWLREAGLQLAKILAHPHLYRHLKAAPKKRVAIEEGAFADDFLDAISQKLEGFTGREIEQLVLRIETSAFALVMGIDETKVTRDIINDVVERSIRIWFAENNYLPIAAITLI